ncbi:TPA: arginine--tRNA ligase [Candidatus Woesearchaeota archaeon]|nr:Arginine-tRNA ligase [archaeon GW2011_AR15]MBS3104327.1 arginine--tRNA ligase [Candidatus Woesearchaeota archaeon]HIH40889.1 arginine--tRNA ligase [Candidatus Woesearchaeota archaeon]
MADFRSHIIGIVNKTSGLKLDESVLEIPPDENMGDYALPCFTLAKELRKSPAEIAKEIGGKISPDKYIGSVKIIGPYVNFFVKKDLLAEDVLAEIYKEKEGYGAGKKRKEKIMIESPGPNTNKPLHLGHVRNMVLGNFLVNIYRFLGYNTIRVDIVNDRGIHICKSMLAYDRFGKNKEPDKKPDHFVGDFYVKYDLEAKSHPEFEQEIQDMLRKWEEGDKEVRKLWKKMNKWAIEGMAETYKRFGVKIDKAYYESDHYTKGRDIVLDALEKGIFKKDEKGNVVLENDSIGKKIVLRADGTSIYITQDIALAKLRYEDYKMDNMIYVVASEQIHHFKSLFEIFRLLDYPFAENCYHLAYGMVYLPEGKMKSREGNVVDADNLADDMNVKSRKEVEKRHKLSGKELERRAEAISMSAIKFFILKYDAMKDFVFNPKESLSFDGETGPYVQYTHARCSSILGKYEKKPSDKIDYSLLNTDEDKALLKLLKSYPEIVKMAGEQYKPSMVTRHVLDLSQAFNEYYHRHQILQDDKELEKARVLLVYCVREVIRSSLGLLGIEAPDEM